MKDEIGAVILKIAIKSIVESNLCTGCGTCMGICPNGAIEFCIVDGLYLPQVQETKCTSCGLCIKSCPGYIVDFEKLFFSIFGKQHDSGLLGNYLGCYIGHSSDEYIRYNSSSGGMISQLLIFALEEGMIDGALVVRMRKNKPLEPEPFIATTREQIISASKSKYCPVPANVALKEIMSQRGKFAVVGLPCHIHGIRKAEVVNKKLREKISLHLGLFCSHTVNFLGTEVLLEKFGIDKHAIGKLEYRANGWPGNLSITLANKHVVRLKHCDFRKEWWNPLFGPYFFTPLRCMCCSDHTNELADLSFGDAWLKEILEKDKIGTSIVISRSKVGEDILKKAELKGKITLNKINHEKVIESQWAPLFFKKISLCSRMRILRSFGKIMPKYYGVKQDVNCVTHIVSLLQLFDVFFSKRKIGILTLKYAPFQLLRVWGALLYYLEVASSRNIRV